MNNWQNIDKPFPYDPNDVDIRQQQFSVDQLLRMIERNRIELWREEYYQRTSNSWNRGQKSRLIESIIMRIPLPMLYFDGSEEPWKIIDGLNRLSTLYSFIHEENWALQQLEFMSEFENYRFTELPYKYQRAILESTLVAYVINPGTPDRVKLNIFQRINTGGKSLTPQEIRNAYYSGIAKDFIDRLSVSSEFLAATKDKISRNGMRDKEVILRFVAFYKFIEEYQTPMTDFLDTVMDRISTFPDLDDIEVQFKKSMKLCVEIFGDSAFYLLDDMGERKSFKINVALFETLTVNFAKLSDVEAEVILKERKKVFRSFTKLFQNKEFHQSISSSTSSKKAIFTRFHSVENVLNILLHGK